MADPEELTVVRGDAPDLATYLAELKQRGSALLITGDVSASARAYVSRQFMGGADVDPPRRRILVDTGVERPDIEQYLPYSVTASDTYVRIVRADSGTRSVATAPEGGIDPGDGLDDLRDDVLDVIADLRDQYDSDSAGILRLGATSLLPLVRRTSGEAVAELCASLGSAIRSSRGMAHYHLPVPGDGRPVDALTATVDAHIELREQNRLVEHRWDILDEAFEDKTDWMVL